MTQEQAPSGGDARPDERAELIARIDVAETSFKRLFLRDRGNPLLSVNLTIQQVRVLLLVHIEEGRSTHELADTLGVGLTTLTGIIDRLEARGLVKRHLDSHDRRVRRITITPAGRALIEDFGNMGRDRRNQLFARLDPRILRNFAESMEVMVQEATNLQEEEQERPEQRDERPRQGSIDHRPVHGETSPG